MRSISTPPRNGTKSPGTVMTITCQLTFTVECVAARMYQLTPAKFIRLRKSDGSATIWPVGQVIDGKRSDMPCAVRQTTVRREGFARNERDSLSRRVPAEDSLLHDQIGKSRGR